MKMRILITLFLVFFSCKNATEKETEQVQIVVDSTELKIETAEKQSENLKLTSFLENPIDLQEFKTKKNKNVTTSVSNGLKYQYHPKIKDSIFYSYNYTIDSIKPIGINEVIVFKHGKNKHTYDDETEILIELNIFHKDPDLGKANLVGLTKTELESEFGTNYSTLKNGIAYSNENKILIIEFNDSEVKSFRYIKLNTEKISNNIFEEIIKPTLKFEKISEIINIIFKVKNAELTTIHKSWKTEYYSLLDSTKIKRFKKYSDFLVIEFNDAKNSINEFNKIKTIAKKSISNKKILFPYYQIFRKGGVSFIQIDNWILVHFLRCNMFPEEYDVEKEFISKLENLNFEIDLVRMRCGWSKAEFN